MAATRKNIRLFICLNAILLGVAFMFSCKTDLEEIKALTTKEVLPSESGTNVEIIYSTNATIQMILSAPKLERYSEGKKYIEMPEGINVLFYDSLMNVRGSIFAKYAIHLLDEDIIELRDSIVIITENNEEVTTDEMFWDRKKKTVYNNKLTRVTTNELVSIGEGFESDERFNQWSFKLPRGTMMVETQELDDGNTIEEDVLPR
jgi:LPS export ABC transporter protein LptC